MPGVGERIQLRRRLRQQRLAREAMLLDLGALVYELHRQGRRAPELLQLKAAELEAVDGEVRELEDALAGIAPEGEEAFEDGTPPEDVTYADSEFDAQLEDEQVDDEELEDEDLDEPLEDEELDDEPLEHEPLEDEPLEHDELDPDDAPSEGAPTVEVDALDDDSRSAGEARS